MDSTKPADSKVSSLEQAKKVTAPKGSKLGDIGELVNLLIGTREIEALADGHNTVYWDLTLYGHQFQAVLKKDTGEGPEAARLPRKV